MNEPGGKPSKYQEPLWKFALIWATGSFAGILIFHGFPPTRERVASWVRFWAAGVRANGFVRVEDPGLRRFKTYRNVEAKLGLNRNGRAYPAAAADSLRSAALAAEPQAVRRQKPLAWRSSAYWSSAM